MTAKERLAIAPAVMPELDAAVRRRQMAEVALGLTPEQARQEARRCLNCPTRPCMQGCPVAIRIPDFLAAVERGDNAAALAIIRENSLLPAICGRVCPQERQCQARCTVGKLLGSVDRAVAIGAVERFVADAVPAAPAPAAPARADAKRVAVIGSGPASLTCAADCARAGLKVTVFEAFHRLGGVLRYGIPEFRLPKRIVDRELAALAALGVGFVTDFVAGKTRSLAELKADYDAVFIGTGAGLPKFMGIPGEELVGVFSANEYLTRANLMRAYDEAHAVTPFYHARRVLVLGGGNVAMDSARMALRLGAEQVTLMYRRSEAEMPARREEVAHARAEGVELRLLANARRLLGDGHGRVVGAECIRYELGAPDASGRRRPVPVAGGEFTLAADAVVVAVGSGANPLLSASESALAVDERGHVRVDAATRMTSIPGVFAGGDIVLGAATVILAMGEGRAAARGIVEYLREG